LLTILLITGCLSDSNPSQPPTDQSLIEIFNGNKQIFIQLKEKICQDKFAVVSLYPEWSDPENIPLELKRQYYKLFKQVNITKIRKGGENTVEFSVWGVGNVSGGDSKGYIFKPSSDWLREERESLDNIPLTGKEFSYQRKIADEWYLYYDHCL
jgi:hypothetical protein